MTHLPAIHYHNGYPCAAIIEYGTPDCAAEHLESIHNSITRLSRELDNVRQHAPGMAAFITQARLLGLQPRPFVTTYGNTTRLNIFVTVQGFLSDVCPQLVAFLEYAADYYPEDPPTSSDNPNAGQRSYDFTGATGSLCLSVIAELDEASQNCERIIVRTQKTQRLVYADVDEPVYAFKC